MTTYADYEMKGINRIRTTIRIYRSRIVLAVAVLRGREDDVR